MVKYVDNVWHATKVAFANEVGRLCKALDIDSHDVMNIFVQDKKLNLSPYYLKPGFAFGGSCLPKEVRAVGHLAQELGVEVPLIDSLMPSNERHVGTGPQAARPLRGKRIGFLGVTFKPGTDDLRESPTLDVMAALLAEGRTICAYDPNLRFGPMLAGPDRLRAPCRTAPGQVDGRARNDHAFHARTSSSPPATSSSSPMRPTRSARLLRAAAAPGCSTSPVSTRTCRTTRHTRASPGRADGNTILRHASKSPGALPGLFSFRRCDRESARNTVKTTLKIAFDYPAFYSTFIKSYTAHCTFFSNIRRTLRTLRSKKPSELQQTRLWRPGNRTIRRVACME